jgi:hypothetical protein
MKINTCTKYGGNMMRLEEWTYKNYKSSDECQENYGRASFQVGRRTGFTI